MSILAGSDMTASVSCIPALRSVSFAHAQPTGGQMETRAQEKKSFGGYWPVRDILV